MLITLHYDYSKEKYIAHTLYFKVSLKRYPPPLRKFTGGRISSPGGDEIRIRIPNSYTNSQIRIRISSSGDEIRIRNFVNSLNSYTKFVYELISSIRLYEISSIQNSSTRNSIRIRIPCSRNSYTKFRIRIGHLGRIVKRN